MPYIKSDSNWDRCLEFPWAFNSSDLEPRSLNDFDL